MPNVTRSHSNASTVSNVAPASIAAGSSVTAFSKLRSHGDASSDDDMSDTSSVSLVSAPFSEEDEDAGLWEASRAHEVAVESVAQNMEYVLLYDDNTSEED
jgi:next to BRCA1 gene 1 protein